MLTRSHLLQQGACRHQCGVFLLVFESRGLSWTLAALSADRRGILSPDEPNVPSLSDGDPASNRGGALLSLLQ